MATCNLTARDIAFYYDKFFKYDRYYRKHTRGGKGKGTMPCLDPQAENQCAVRLSCALEGLSPGFLDEFDPANRVHRDRPTCMNLPPHVLGAAELGRYMSRVWGPPITLPKLLGARTLLEGRPGLLWFEKCYVNHGNLSDHVDFWTGRSYMNELFHDGGATDEDTGVPHKKPPDLFVRSHGNVQFFPLVN